MKIHSRLLIGGMVAAVLLSAFHVYDASAADLTDEQSARISVNCLTIKSSLNQLHASDALLRVNRGQIYESMGTKLMSSFNGRLGSNSLDNKGLVSVTDSYQTALTTFRDDYRTYEQQLSTVIKIDCAAQPAAFHDALVNARTKRAKVHTDVLRLHQYIDDYRSAINDFMLNFDRVTGGN